MLNNTFGTLVYIGCSNAEINYGSENLQQQVSADKKKDEATKYIN